jgi:hypothetical protein
VKKLEDMSLAEAVDYWTGRLTLAIGAEETKKKRGGRS